MSNKSTIIIDARFYGSEHTGLGRYATNVLQYLPGHLAGYSLKVLLRRQYYHSLVLPKNCEKILADTAHYSVGEQLTVGRLIDSLGADLMYTFHFNVPILMKTPFVVTIHDLIKSHFTGPETTTRAAWLFRIKRFGYEMAMRHAITAARSIIVPSNTVKNDILALYNSDPTLINPIPEAPDEIFRQASKTKKGIPGLPSHYLLFVGNAYPHKNVHVLLQAMELLTEKELVLVAKTTPFLNRLMTVTPESVKRRITILENVSNHDLVSIYKGADLLVTPSLMEGYGLPGIEALMVGTPVVASNIPVYREVYKDNVTYFDPHSPSDLSRAINSAKKDAHAVYSRTWDDVAANIAEVLDENCTRL